MNGIAVTILPGICLIGSIQFGLQDNWWAAVCYAASGFFIFAGTEIRSK